MEELFHAEANEPEQQRPIWSVLSGEFDPANPAINGILVARIADKFWYANPDSEGRRTLQSIELVLRSYELCGLQRSIAEEKVTNTAIALRAYSKQAGIFALTPELGTEKSELDRTAGTTLAVELSPSPILNALRKLIKKSNELDMITFHDRQVRDKKRWEVDDRTKRLAESIVRSLYREECSLEISELVE